TMGNRPRTEWLVVARVEELSPHAIAIKIDFHRVQRWIADLQQPRKALAWLQAQGKPDRCFLQAEVWRLALVLLPLNRLQVLGELVGIPGGIGVDGMNQVGSDVEEDGVIYQNGRYRAGDGDLLKRYQHQGDCREELFAQNAPELCNRSRSVQCHVGKISV